MNGESERPLMVRDDNALTVHFSPQAEELKEVALSSSALVGRVADANENSTAVAAQAELDNVLRMAEKARKTIKAPVIELGKKIDSLHEKFVTALLEERTRVTRLIADFQAAELARVRAAEAAARLEAERIERERQAEMRRIAEAEALQKQRLEAEQRKIAEAAAKAKNDAERAEAAKLQQEVNRQKELAASASLEQMEAVQERYNAQAATLASQPQPQAARADGQVVKQDWEIEVTNPYDLAKYHPNCVNISPRLADIKELLRQGVTVRGIKATPIVKVQTRANAAGQKVIDV